MQLPLALPRTLDSTAEFSACLNRFFTTPVADAVLRWSFPHTARADLLAQAQGIQTPEAFQHTYVNPLFARILAQTSQGLSISGLDELPRDRKFLFLSNHRCIVTDAALVSLNLLSSGRGTCKVCVGDNLMAAPGVAEMMLLLNGISIMRSGSRREVYDNAKYVASYLAQQIQEQRYSVWLSQSPGRTKDGNDRTAAAIVKMLGMQGQGLRVDYAALHIVPVTISYEHEPCLVYKVRENLLRQASGRYDKLPGEDVVQIRDSLVNDKGRVHLAFGTELQLEDVADTDVVQAIVDQTDAQMALNYRCWGSNRIAHALLNGHPVDLRTPYARAFMDRVDEQLAQLEQMGLERHVARSALLQVLAQPIVNAQRACSSVAALV